MQLTVDIIRSFVRDGFEVDTTIEHQRHTNRHARRSGHTSDYMGRLLGTETTLALGTLDGSRELGRQRGKKGFLVFVKHMLAALHCDDA